MEEKEWLVQSGIENKQITIDDWIAEVNKRIQALEDKSKNKFRRMVEDQID